MVVHNTTTTVGVVTPTLHCDNRPYRQTDSTARLVRRLSLTGAGLLVLTGRGNVNGGRAARPDGSGDAHSSISNDSREGEVVFGWRWWFGEGEGGQRPYIRRRCTPIHCPFSDPAPPPPPFVAMSGPYLRHFVR